MSSTQTLVKFTRPVGSPLSVASKAMWPEELTVGAYVQKSVDGEPGIGSARGYGVADGAVGALNIPGASRAAVDGAAEDEHAVICHRYDADV